MATQFSGHYYYKDGAGGVSTVIGYESNSNRVLRVNFTTGDKGATSISIYVSPGTIQCQDGTSYTSIPFYITESSTSHANANGADGYAVTGYITGKTEQAYSGSADVVLKANTTYYVWFFPPNKTYGWSYWHRNTNHVWSEYELSGTSKFSLSISAGSNSSISVNRTSSAVGMSTGTLSNGSTIYKNDKLKITFAADTNYSVGTRTVNGSAFTSGNTHTVSGDVYVVSSAQALESAIGATDANIGSTSTITVNRYNTSYCYSLQYTFGSVKGYIDANGNTLQSEVKMQAASVPFKVPLTFYNVIPNQTSGVCTIFCRTYENRASTTPIGSVKSCTFVATASVDACRPAVSGSVVDTNANTVALTGDSSILIRYKSTAKCTINAIAKNSSELSLCKINGNVISGTNMSKSFPSITSNEFGLYAMDTRGYTNSVTVTAQMVDYIPLTCIADAYRPSPTGNRIAFRVRGNMYRGSFGAYSNTLTLKYRYRKAGGSYGSWITIDQKYITIGASSYKTADIELVSTDESGFDYQQDYDLQISAADGANGYVLTGITKTVPIGRGLPVFDWGRDDFNVNAILKLKEVNILDIIYPVGSVYMHSGSEMPPTVSGIGTWEKISTDISGIYAWERKA